MIASTTNSKCNVIKLGNPLKDIVPSRAKVVNFLFIMMKCVHRVYMLMGICMVVYVGVNLSAVLSWGRNIPFLHYCCDNVLCFWKLWEITVILPSPLPLIPTWQRKRWQLRVDSQLLFFKLNWFVESKNLRTPSIRSRSLPACHGS